MTIVEGELVAATRPPVAAMEEALKQSFTVQVGEAATFERIYFDTFDALLRAEGLTLRFERGRFELLTDDAELPRQAATAARPTGPLRTADLPLGDLRDVTAKVIGVRAVIPLARVRVTIETVAVLDELQKTIARVVIETPELLSASDRPSRLRARVRLLGVRGYDAERETVRRLISRELALGEADCPLRDEAVRAAGGEPAGIGSKVDVPLVGDERADIAAAKVLRALLHVMDANLPGTIADTDSEFLHDYRVSVRRTRSVQRELRGVFPREDLARMRAEFKWLQQVTGDSRDLDVHVLGFPELRAMVPEAMAPDLDPLLTVLQGRRLAAHRAMVRELRGERARQLRRDWAGLLAGLPDRPLTDRPDAASSIDAIASERIRKVYTRMVKMGEAIVAGGADTPAVDYHELRKKGKELRYLLELFGQPIHDKTVVKPMIKTLKGLQDVLGRHQDREVQIDTLRALSDEVSSLPGGARALMAMGILIERIEADAAAAREEFAASFQEFSAPAQRELVKDTFST